MAYTPSNNPYIAGDPYSYDLKWLVRKIREHDSALAAIPDQIQAAVIAALDQHDPVYYKTAAEMIASGQKAGSIAYIEGYYTEGDGGANLYYLTDDYNDIIGANYYITIGANLWALPVITTPFVTPEMFGAYGDGTTDDTAAITTASKYKNVVLMPKTYAVYDSGLTLTNGTTIEGHNSKLSLISAETNSHIIRNTDKSDIVIKNVVFDGAGASSSTYASALQFINASNIKIIDCDFYNFTNNAVQFSYANNCELRNAAIDNTGLTVAYNSDHVVFDNVKVTNCVFAYHLQLKSCQYSAINNCYVEMNDGSEFAIMVSYGNAETDPEANTENTVANCKVVYNGTGISNAAYRTNGVSSNITYTNCSAYGAPFHISDASNIKIIGCTADHSTTNGIIANNISDSIISNCFITNANFSGITISNQTAPLLIADNILKNNNVADNINYRQIAVAAGCSFVDILNNNITIDSGTTYFIGLSGNPENIRVINNKCTGAGAIINGSPDISNSIIEGNGFGAYRGFNGFTSLNAEISVKEGQTIIAKYFTAAPSTGTFAAGDIAYIKTPSAAVPLGWTYDGAVWNVI